MAERALDSGERIEVFVSSATLVRERDEVFRAFRVTLIVGILLVGAVAVPASWLALAPLRRATSVVEAVDVRSLSTRLPTRETNDDVDRHVRVVNRLLDQLERGFASLDAFSQDVAHELRTPVHRILNACEALLLDSAYAGRSRSELHTIAQTAEQMSRLVDGLLILARGERDALALRREAVDVASLCRTIAEIYEPACDRAGVRLEVDCAPSRVSADPSLLLRALGNLLDNALAHTPSGGAIRIRGGVDPDDPGRVRLEVEDDGPGIPEVLRDRIFDRFLRSPSATPGSGVGLGLPIARAIARAHGGELALVAAESASEIRGAATVANGGARFVFSLPRLTASDHPSQASGIEPDSFEVGGRLSA